MRVRIFDESGKVIKDKRHEKVKDGYYDFSFTAKDAEIYYIKTNSGS